MHAGQMLQCPNVHRPVSESESLTYMSTVKALFIETWKGCTLRTWRDRLQTGDVIQWPTRDRAHTG